MPPDRETGKRTTIGDIAERAGVSIGAVSYALNGRPGVSDATRQRIIAIADQVGWRPNISARALSQSRAHAIGLVIARSAETLGIEPFFMRFIAGLESELTAARTALLLQVVPDHTAAILAMRTWWAERRIDGVIVTDLWVDDRRIRLLENSRIPAVLVGHPRSDSSAPSVWNDETPAVAAAVEHLVGLGHRRIARVAGLSALEHTRVRTQAFRAAMRGHGPSGGTVIDTDYTGEQGAQATRTLLDRRDPPTAVIFDNDVMAVAALGVARERGVSVPGQLSILAGDDSPLCALAHPTITALSRDVSAFAAQAASTLLKLISSEHVDSAQTATAALVARGSTGPVVQPAMKRAR